MMRKFKINWKTVARNVIVLLNIAVVAVLIYTLKTKGIEFFSTIRIFWLKKEDLIMKKDQALTLLQIVEDCTDVIAKEIEAGLKPNSLLIDYMKERLEGVLEYKGE